MDYTQPPPVPDNVMQQMQMPPPSYQPKQNYHNYHHNKGFNYNKGYNHFNKHGGMHQDDFDGKRLRKSVMRKTVDYNASIVRALQVFILLFIVLFSLKVIILSQSLEIGLNRA